MAELKPFTSYEEQIEKLTCRGCIISDKEKCLDILKHTNYYRLSAYFLPFRKTNDNYIEGTSLIQVYRIYEFDRKLRNLIFSAIEVIEVSLRSRLAHFHAELYGPDGYMNPDFFNSKHNSQKFNERLQSEINSNEKVPFVRHHIDMYDGRFPLWAAIELFTFGMLSYFYNDLKTCDKKKFANVHYKEMGSWLRCCTDLRNICAHYGRLYFRVFTAVPAGLDLTPEQGRSLWGAIKVLKALYPDPIRWKSEFLAPFSALIEEYKDDIYLEHIAFPENWHEQL